MQCGTSKLIWPIFVYFRLHYTLCKRSAPRAPSRDGEAATNPVPCSKQPSALVFEPKKSTPITKMGRKLWDKPSIPPFSMSDFFVQAVMNSFNIGLFFTCSIYFFKPSLCTNFGRRSRGVSLELSECSRESSKGAALYFPALSVHVQMHRDIFLTVAQSRFPTPG